MPTKIGCHASISPNVLAGIQYTHQNLGANAIQIFLGSSHSASLKTKTKLTDEEMSDIKAYVTKNNIYLVVHACYLLNFCKYPSTSSGIQYAINNLVHDLNMCPQIGAQGVVIHLGYQMALTEDEAYQNMVDCVQKAIDKSEGPAKVLLETCAGQGSNIAVSLEDFAELFNMFPKKYHKKLGICVDTCHVFSAGAGELHTVDGTKKFFRDFNKLIGKEHLTLLHINDSKKPFQCRKDQHEGIGYGYIYDKEKGGDLKALEYLTQYASKNKIPMVLETHGGASPKQKEKNTGNYLDEIALLNKFAKTKSSSSRTTKSK